MTRTDDNSLDNQQFYSLPKDFQDDWKDLHDLTSGR